MQAALLAVRERGSSSLASAFLSQERGPRSVTELDAFADSLVRIAIAFKPGDPRSEQRAAGSASVALLSAARPDRAVPYPHAFEALVRIYEGSTEPGRRGSTLWLMTQLPNQGPVLDFLAKVASASGPGTATTAIRHLAHDTGEAGLARLRRLYEENTVVDPIAREHLRAIALVHEWEGGDVHP